MFNPGIVSSCASCFTDLMQDTHTIDGFGLLEVLLASFLLATALLSLLWLQTRDLQAITAAYYESVAVFQLSSLYERLLIAKTAQIATTVTQWDKENHTILPQGVGQWRCHHQHCKATVQWDFHGAYHLSFQALQ